MESTGFKVYKFTVCKCTIARPAIVDVGRYIKGGPTTNKGMHGY